MKTMYLNKADVGLKLYRLTAIHSLKIEQEIKARNEKEAFDLYLSKGGLKHDGITSENITEERLDEIETRAIDASTPKTTLEYRGTVIQNENDEDEVSVEYRFEDKHEI
jgi:hypothetical protein